MEEEVVVAPSEEVKLKEDYEDLATTLHGRLRGTDQEYILCAANWYQYPMKSEHQPVNIDCGFVVCGRRHHNIFMITSILDDDSTLERNKFCEQGFLTSKDRWVDRKEAGDIAFKAGQTKELRKVLFSEDLY